MIRLGLSPSPQANVLTEVDPRPFTCGFRGLSNLLCKYQRAAENQFPRLGARHHNPHSRSQPQIALSLPQPALGLDQMSLYYPMHRSIPIVAASTSTYLTFFPTYRLGPSAQELLDRPTPHCLSAGRAAGRTGARHDHGPNPSHTVPLHRDRSGRCDLRSTDEEDSVAITGWRGASESIRSRQSRQAKLRRTRTRSWDRARPHDSATLYTY